jgi:MFS family permease
VRQDEAIALSGLRLKTNQKTGIADHQDILADKYFLPTLGSMKRPAESMANTKISGNILLFAICFISSTFGGVVSTLMSVYLPVAVKELLGDTTTEKLNGVSAAINSVFIFGWMFGGMTWGLVCDRIGRPKSVILSTAFFGLFTLLTAVAPSWLWVTILRFLSGFGVGGVLVTTTILVAEAWSGKQRAVALGILSISIPVGIFSAGLINYLLPGWRSAFSVGLIPLLLCVLAVFSLRGSVKWNSSVKSNSGEPDPRVKEESVKVQVTARQFRKNLWLGSLIFGTMLIGMWAIFSWLPTWVQSLSEKVDAQQERGLSMMLLGAGGLTGGFVSGWIAHAIGLRRTMLWCFASCLVLSFFLFRTNAHFSGIAYGELAVMALFFGISQGALSAYIPELFPTAIRASATGFCFNAGRLFTATAVFFVGFLVSLLGGYGNALFVFSFIFLAGWITTWLAGG